MEENGIHQPEDQFPPERISSVFKNWFSLMTVTASRKRLSSKVTFSIRQKHPSPIAGMKDSFKNTFLLDRKKSFPRLESLKKYKKWFVIVRKSVYTTRNEAFVEKYISTIRKNCYFWQENKINGFHQQQNVFLLKLVPPNFNNGFQHQKKSSEQKHTVSTRQKISFHQPE